MSIKPVQRGNVWHAVGRVEYNGRPITRRIRKSTGASTEAGAWDWIKAFEAREIRRYLLGDEAEVVTFAMAVIEYDAKPTDAGYLATILEAKPEFARMPLGEITGRFVKKLGLEIYPHAATDTIWRQVVTPIRAVINNMHELGKCPPIRIKAYTEQERIDRDESRGKQSRKPRSAGSKEWLEAFRAHADPYNAAMARFMFQTGARIGQAVALLPKDLDLMNQRVWVKAQKGHAAQWVSISHEMMIELANLKPKQPYSREHNKRLPARVFGYATTRGYRKRWATICKAAGIPTLTAHEAGRHGFATEMVVRQGVDAVTAAEGGRWKSPQLLHDRYAHAEEKEADLRERFDTDTTQRRRSKSSKNMKRNG